MFNFVFCFSYCFRFVFSSVSLRLIACLVFPLVWLSFSTSLFFQVWLPLHFLLLFCLDLNLCCFSFANNNCFQLVFVCAFVPIHNYDSAFRKFVICSSCRAPDKWFVLMFVNVPVDRCYWLTAKNLSLFKELNRPLQSKKVSTLILH